MSIRKRRNKLGKQTAEYHYEFMQSGKRYYGVCEGCNTERAAIAYEKNIKANIKKLAEQKSIGALVENFKKELTGGDKITLDKAFELYLAKPRKKKPSEKQTKINKSQWDDFCAFVNISYPEVIQLDKVSRLHAETYIKQLRDSGRFSQSVNYSAKRDGQVISCSYKTQKQLSPRTINAYHKTLKSVFAKLKEDAGILYNPFEFEMLNNNSESREAFSPEELKLIGDNLNDFVKPLFTIGICTGLTEGDICKLKWSEIKDKWITRKRRKTGAKLEIPILPPLAAFLNEQKNVSGDDEFVLPEHSTMYTENPSGVSYRIKSFLESLGIKTTRKVEGRSRAISVKDLHSLRHTFAYLAGCYQIPLPIVQSVLGHMSPEMTKHYQSHADREAKEKYLSQMPNFLEISSKTLEVENIIESERLQLKEYTDKMSIELIRKVLLYIERESNGK